MNTLAQLESTIADTALRHVNFFNGRLLSGEDLSAEREANHAHARYLGQAAGAGVVHGLEVTRPEASPLSDIQVTVKAGLAINENGQALRLACDQTVSLVRPADPSRRADCVFSDCGPFAAGTSLSGDGYYLLTIAPASQREGLAPVSGLGNSPAACNSRYLTEGVQFRLLPLRVTAPATVARARNEVAYQCLPVTSRRLGDLAANAWSAGASGSELLNQRIPGQRLTPHDVPLAVIEWSSRGVGFIDRWCVRRRLRRPELGEAWCVSVDDSTRSEGEARLLQFHDQIESMRGSATNPALVEARGHFRFLPPAGVVPLADARHPQGFDWQRFFNGLTARHPLHLEGARVPALLQLSLSFPPIDLAGADMKMLWLYLVRENRMVVDRGVAGSPQPYLVFASGQIPYCAEPRFDVARWSYSNFVIA